MDVIYLELINGLNPAAVRSCEDEAPPFCRSKLGVRHLLRASVPTFRHAISDCMNCLSLRRHLIGSGFPLLLAAESWMRLT